MPVAFLMVAFRGCEMPEPYKHVVRNGRHRFLRSVRSAKTERGMATFQLTKVVCGRPVRPYDLIIGRAILECGTLTAGSGMFEFRIESGHHEPTHG